MNNRLDAFCCVKNKIRPNAFCIRADFCVSCYSLTGDRQDEQFRPVGNRFVYFAVSVSSGIAAGFYCCTTLLNQGRGFRGSQGVVKQHNVLITAVFEPEPSRHHAQFDKTELFIQPDGRCVGFYYCVELQDPITKLAGFSKAVAH